MNYVQLLSIAISLAVGLGSGWLGAWMGIKIAIVRLEIGQETADLAINRLTVDVSAHRDDILIHDIELGTIHTHLGIERTRRQMMR